MSLNGYNSFNIFNRPLNNYSGYKAVVENNKKELKNETPRQEAKNTNLSEDLDNLSEFNKANITTQAADSQSEYAVSCFESIVQSSQLPPQEIITLYRQFNLQVSNLSPESKQKLDTALHGALFNAFKPVVTMDDQSRSAISNFKSTLDASFTRDEMVELFVRFSREISINFPEAWKELESVLSNNLSSAFQVDNSMDSQSRSAISNFKSSIHSDLTKDEMVELFVRFSREISVKYPDAWKELSSVLANSLALAYVPDNSIDGQSSNAISNFRSTINSNLTKDEMVELFVRFSREISIKFPKAWNQLESILDNMLPVAFKLDTSIDGQSKNAISNFKNTINSSMTKDQMVELFIRFSREISINYPDAWRQLESILSKEVPNAFKPVTTIDDNSRDVATEFVNRVVLEKLSTDELEDLFGNYVKQISLKHIDAKKKIENAYQNNTKKSETKDKEEKKEQYNSLGMVKFFQELVQKVNHLDEQVRNASNELASADNKDEIQQRLAEIGKIEANKETLDSSYNNTIRNIFGNKFANENISDNYKSNLDVSKDRPDDKKLQEKEMKQLTRWDMLREMRRKEVLGILEDQKKDNLVEQLISIPKFILKRILLNQVHEKQCEMLMEQRYPEALLRSIPKSNAKKQLPKAEDMLPVMMMTGRLSNGQTGMELIRSVMVGDFKAEKSPNETRAKEEIVPFVADMLLNKPPKAADALKATENIGKPKSENFHKLVDKDVNKLANGKKDLVAGFLGLDNDDIDENQTAGRRDNKVDFSNENKNRLPRLELLSMGQLLELAKDKVDEFTEDQSQDTLRAKRGSNKEACEFLDSLDNVNSLASAKIAVAVLYNHQQQLLKQAVIPHMDESDMVKLTLGHGKAKEDMVKDMPWYTIQDQIKNLPKVQMVDSFNKLDKSEIIGAFKQLPSQVVASIAFDAVDRTTVSENLLNKKGFAAA
ncbi:MAG: hypothetical protein AB1782_06930 [Cyanobacteriota bacterium]